ncbi:three-Cys-motif partner protein TcmP [Actinomadura rudentiformis]|uniref:three-Cys-motif partner protein TcmP n=1 Tax=Actinomadura rudentiformis TaxID=359158 RepID=UPI00178C57A7|nr:three-Cys-motif partner protein TcmP [Actinomadura rudentiformis]
MPVPSEPIWSCDPHTVAKHQILKVYLKQWLPTLLLGGYRGVTYAEGFAGSGVYQGGEAGSPVIALRAALGQRQLLEAGKTVDLVFIEEDQRRFDILKQELTKVWAAASQAAPVPATLRRPHLRCADHADVLLPVLEQIGAMRQPVFAFLDSWGGTDVPLDIARAIATAPASEVLVTFGTRYLIRFGEQDRQKEEGDRVFGGTAWRKVFTLPAGQKKLFLVSTYRRSLQEAGFRYVTSFEMLDEGGHDLHLVHGTSHLRGLEKMKNAMWEVDKVGGVQFRDPRDPAQGLLELGLEPNLMGPLHRALQARLTERPHTVAELKQHALCETAYRAQHVFPLVRRMLREGHIEQSTPGPLSDNTLLQLAGPKPVQDSLF